MLTDLMSVLVERTIFMPETTWLLKKIHSSFQIIDNYCYISAFTGVDYDIKLGQSAEPLPLFMSVSVI